jgi:curved DNA-binding protein
MAGRNKPRRRINARYLASWTDANGKPQSVSVQGRDSSKTGIGFDSTAPIDPGTPVTIETESREPVGAGVVRYCMRRGTGFGIGVEFTSEESPGASKAAAAEDYYETLQISHRADAETVRRVYRIMAARMHPDNKQTGNLEKFLQLKKAFEVLSDPEQRAAYDASQESQQDAPMPIFESKEFVDGVDGEMNRRLGVLSLLYHQRRMDEAHPGISVLELEKRMSFPREYLHFTTWYLRSKGYVTVEDNSDFILTAAGVDYVEEHSPTNALLQKLMLPAGSPTGSQAESAAAK